MSVLNQSMDEARKDDNVHTLLLLNTSEEYNKLAASLKPLSDVMKAVQEAGVDLDGEHFSVEFFLASDYKFLALVLGHEGARALFNCIWCLANRNHWKATLQKVKSLPSFVV
jgi:hypothetical protein